MKRRDIAYDIQRELYWNKIR